MAVQDERLRIARELHDLVSHGFGLMIVRAATAQLADESERHLALADIERVGRSAMSELRRMLTVLRAQGTSEVPMQPLESLADLRGIVGTARKAGAEVQLTIDELGDVPAALQVTICAMVREALANVVRHAGKTSVWVAITSTESGIRVDVRDAGPSPNWKPQTGTGYGLVGLRERVKLHGGTILAQPFETGFRVTADLPLVLRR
jgi:signal transduction histidine kinase